MGRGVGPIALLSLTACSLTTATGFIECDLDSQCGSDRVCLEHFCIPLAPGCSRQAGAFDTTNRVVFAAALPVSLSPGDAGKDQSELQGLNALSLALEEGNQRDGIKGKKFALFFCDTASDDARAKEQVKWLATQLKVPAIMTSGSGQTIAVANQVLSENVLVMSATATAPELIGTYQSNKHLVWRTAPPDTLQARVLVDLINAKFGMVPAPKIGILYVDTTYGQGLKGALRPRLEAAGAADGGASRYLVREVPYAFNAIAPAVKSLEQFAPNLTVLIGFPVDIQSIISLSRISSTLSRDAGHQWVFTDSAKDPALLSGTLGELVGSTGTAPAQGDSPSYGEFQDRFKARYHTDPSSFSFTSHSYDAMYLLMLSATWAAGKGELTGPKMADGMLHVSSGAQFAMVPTNFTAMVSSLLAGTAIDVQGSSGKLNFDPDAGAPASRYELWSVEADGGFSSTIVEPTGN